MIELTYEMALNFAAQAVEEKGEDYVYSDEKGIRADAPGSIAGCSNWHHVDPDDHDKGKVPGCIVGNILHRAGLDIFKYGKGSDISGIAFQAGDEIMIHPKAYEFLRIAQLRQDSGAPWGVAVKTAKARTATILEK